MKTRVHQAGLDVMSLRIKGLGEGGPFQNMSMQASRRGCVGCLPIFMTQHPIICFLLTVAVGFDRFVVVTHGDLKFVFEI